MEMDEIKRALEALLFVTDHPLSIAELEKLLGRKKSEAGIVATLIAELRDELAQRNSSVQIVELAGGFQMATRPVYGPWVRKLFADRLTMRLSTAAHETLSIIAYKQPLTRAEIEQIRGVEVIASLETLLEKRLVRVVGRKETVGRPLLYGTTSEFLRHFGLGSLEDMPALESFAEAKPETPAPAEASSEASVQPEFQDQPQAEPPTEPQAESQAQSQPESPAVETQAPEQQPESV
jgi:segregation and condensation protein B